MADIVEDITRLRAENAVLMTALRTADPKFGALVDQLFSHCRAAQLVLVRAHGMVRRAEAKDGDDPQFPGSYAPPAITYPPGFAASYDESREVKGAGLRPADMLGLFLLGVVAGLGVVALAWGLR